MYNNVYLTGGFRENNISFSGTTINNPTPGASSHYLVKFDPDNKVAWYKTVFEPGASPDSINVYGGAWGYSISVSNCGLVWVSGAMSDSVDIDGHILRKPYASCDPIFLASFTAGGVYQESASLGSGGDDQNGIATDPMGNVFMCSDNMCRQLVFAGDDTLPKIDSAEALFVAKYQRKKSGNKSSRYSDHVVCGNVGTPLAAPEGYSHYIWSTGETVNEISYAGGAKVIYVYAFDSCAVSETDSFIIGEPCNCGRSLYVPNLFTPNGDGQNDIFYPRGGTEIMLVKSFRVYNRWGELVFVKRNIAINDAANAWDGKYKGMDPRPEVYVWTAEVQCTDGGSSNYKGNVTLMR
jgi:gliding motility-associated-like protein